MVNRIDGCHFEGNGVAISVGKGTEVEVTNTVVRNNGQGYVERNDGEDSEATRTALAFIAAAKAGASAEQLLKEHGPALKAKGFDLSALLSNGANAATILTSMSAAAKFFGIPV